MSVDQPKRKLASPVQAGSRTPCSPPPFGRQNRLEKIISTLSWAGAQCQCKCKSIGCFTSTTMLILFFNKAWDTRTVRWWWRSLQTRRKVSVSVVRCSKWSSLSPWCLARQKYKTKSGDWLLGRRLESTDCPSWSADMGLGDWFIAWRVVFD